MAEQPQNKNPFELSTEDMDKQFDIVINFFKTNPILNRSRFMMKPLSKIGRPDDILPRMVDYKLLKIGKDMDGRTFRLTRYGYEVLRAGGWIQYHNDKIEHDKLIRDQVKSTIDTNKFQKTVLFSTIALSIGTFFLAYYTFRSNENLLDIERQRFEREKTQINAPAINPNVNVTLKRDTIVIVQPTKKSK